MSVENMSKQEIWRITGELLDYPSCCIDEFCGQKGTAKFANSEQKLVIKWINAANLFGFVPCKKCAARILEKASQVEVADRVKFYQEELRKMMPRRKFE